MIGRSDGGFAGGVLPLTDEMQQHGARPTWLGYISASTTSMQRSPAIEAGRRQDADAADRHPAGRPDRDGHRPAGRALLRHEADPAGRSTRTRRATSSRRPPSSASAGTSCRPATRTRRATSTASQFGWTSDDSCRWASMGEYRFIDHDGHDASARSCEADAAASSRTGAFTSGCRRSPRPRTRSKRSGGTILDGPAWSARAATISSSAIDPQGAEFALVGKA